MSGTPPTRKGAGLVLTAALLGWMFDGFEMGLFPLVARPALKDLLGSEVSEDEIGKWYSLATAGFLIGAATGGVLFGWLGDRLGRVRAMTISVLTYATFSGLCGLATAPWQLGVLRFVAALGMGGEWALGVALVMEVWPDAARGWLAGCIGAAGNLGYVFVALLALSLNQVQEPLRDFLLFVGLSPEKWLAGNGWRVLLLLGATPALLTLLIRLFVPESHKWEGEQAKGTTQNWATRDLLGVLIGATAALSFVGLWMQKEMDFYLQVAISIPLLVVTTLGYLYPVSRYLQRTAPLEYGTTVYRLFLGAALSGVPLIVTWSAVMWAYMWVGTLTNDPNARPFAQLASASGAVVGSFFGAIIGDRFGRRATYRGLCVASCATALIFFLTNQSFNAWFLVTCGTTGLVTAAFYGWLPLYLPELFRTAVRATGQGFCFNFGRVIAAVAVLQTSNLMAFFGGSYPYACSVMCLAYVVGFFLIGLAPETKGQALPE